MSSSGKERYGDRTAPPKGELSHFEPDRHATGPASLPTVGAGSGPDFRRSKRGMTDPGSCILRRGHKSRAALGFPASFRWVSAAGREARLSYMCHAVMENRHGLAVAGTVTHADGTAERRASEAMLRRKARRRGPPVECIFGWGKQHGTMRKTKHRGIAAVGGDFMLDLIACNLVRACFPDPGAGTRPAYLEGISWSSRLRSPRIGSRSRTGYWTAWNAKGPRLSVCRPTIRLRTIAAHTCASQNRWVRWINSGSSPWKAGSATFASALKSCSRACGSFG